MSSDKPPGTEDTIAGTPAPQAALDETLAGPGATTQPRPAIDSGVRSKTIGDSLRGANIESFDPVHRGRYEILGEMARGGLGRVLRARDPRTGRIVALKEIIVPNHDTRTRFAREALVTANLQHPSIVPVYEVGRWPDGEPFYAMKLVEGRTLTEVIARAQTPAERMALLPHAIAVADALAYAHSEHVIHRDLKPSNVLVGSYGETVVIDWGLARNTATGQEVGALSNPSIDLGADTIVGAVIGTPSYMPPEQALGAPLDEGADVYAIGALMYQMISGARPYADAATANEVVERVKAGPPFPLAKLAPEAPAELIAIVEKAMARSLAARYRTAEVLAEDLRRFQTGKLVGAHHYTTWQLVRRWLGRHRAILATAVAALVALAVVGVISVRRISAERDLAQEQRGLAQEAEKLAVERYAASLEELARQASLAGAPERALALLAGAPAPRSSSGALLAGQASAAFADLVGVAPAQAKSTLAATISRDGKLLVVASGEGKLVAWDVAHGAQRWTGEGLLVELAPDDATLLVARGDAVALLASADGKQLAAWKVGEDVATLGWSPAGDRFAVGGAAGAVAIGTPAGALVPADRHAQRVRAIAWGAAGALATAGDDGAVIVRDGARPAQHLVDTKLALWSLAWVDPTHLVAGGPDHVARLWNVTTGAVEKRFDHGIDIYGVVAGKTWIATFGYGEHLKVWPLDGGPVRELVGHRLGLNNGVTVGDALVTSDETGQVIAWDPETGQRLRTLPEEGLLDGLVSRKGLLVTFGELRTRVWRLDPGAIVRRATGHTARVRDLLVTDDTVWTASNDGTARSFGLDGTARLVLGTADFAEPIITGPADPNGRKPPNPKGARAVVFAPGGERVATTYEDGRIVLWDRATGAQLATWTGHTRRVRGLAFAPDGAVAYSVGDTTLRKWDAATGAELAHADLGDGGWAVAVHGDVVATQTDGGKLALWSAATLAPGAPVTLGKEYLHDLPFAGDLLLVADEEKVGLLDPHTGQLVRSAPHPLSFSSDFGATTIVAGDSHGEIALFDRATLARIRTWKSGDELVTAVRLRPDGKVVATASARNVRIWDPASGTLLAELRDLPTMPVRIEWSPDGNHLAIAGGAPIVWLWNLTPGAATASCVLPWRLVDGALAAPPPSSAWCATSR